MHLIFVTSLVPDGEPATGYEIANAAIIAALRRSGARVTVLGYTWPGKAPSDPHNTISLGEIDVRTEGAGALRKMRWLAGAVLSGLTFASAKLRAAGEADIRAALKRAEPFDAYVINAAQFAGAFEHLFADRPSLFVAHNVEHRSAEENAEAVRDLVQRTLFRREARLVRAVEQRLCDRAAFVYTLAEEDRAALGVAEDHRSAALPLVTRSEAPEPCVPRTIVCDAALIGTWTWQPNRIGLEWFLRDVTPWLPRNFRTRVAGSIPADLPCPPGVEFVGRVANAVDFVRGGAVVPLIARAGTGVQLKTIEAFEQGLPCVATSRSLRGIAHLPANCRIADDPAAFATELAAMAADRIEDVDGRTFHAAQLQVLDASIALGLSAIGSRPTRQAVAA
ncbi:glycosyltransferase [Aquibium carbonis]|uniref:Glycosyltransferase n=1 Tax=Aquibium carbonis TaxID=2495581 RepID=A0A429Z036_9HYPH|nr:glycosyltransferase family 4 protein [Aquibium carbonis]RST87075.1 glycosyltransferase [Aquibium carbonis]